ncbi:CPBP family intramembrane metalloprotease [Paenibacillus sp. MER TA 81-3]|uniref:type II CAAX endopeptidase family protein n=1 Tax=Paenibacillus sp. MER TA 81-3 TaxID=2939573 RepID=UPI00203F5601|nr:type II CAAX endopeptidase family protein [Paenibacillus sp. MER TA 81-3]MCM3342107.1 CPBP family intramembrane metalloprotease [Paenibacillus sp. MER TA 81-3]
MTKGMNAIHAGWLFLVSYITGNVLSTFIFPDKQQLYANLGFFLLYVAFAQIGLNVIPSIVLKSSKKLSWVSVFKFRKVTWCTMLLSILIYAVSQIVMLFIHQATEIISAALGRTYQVSIYPIATDITSLFLLIVAIGVIPPICEELLFRGVLLTGYEQKGRWFAAAMSSVLFALFHDNPYRLLELFFAAWVSALIVLYARSIWPGIVIHMATNILYVIGSYMQGGDLVKSISSPSGSPDYILLGFSGAASIPALYLCLLLLRKIDKIERPRNHSKDIYSTSSDIKYWQVPILISVCWFIFEMIMIYKT